MPGPIPPGSDDRETPGVVARRASTGNSESVGPSSMKCIKITALGICILRITASLPKCLQGTEQPVRVQPQ
jgi:hypothetical protein